MDELPRGTKEYVKVRVTADIDLSSGTVEIGIGPPLDSPTWQSAVWVGAPLSTPDGYEHTIRTSLVWDTTSVQTGYWEIWGRVTDTPEIIVRRAGMLRVV
jgi:hypothetical protein